MELISRKALIEALRKDRESVYSHVFCHTDCQHEEELSLDLEQFIENQPTVEVPQWIPCSERLPEQRDWYLAVFKEPDTGFIGLPYIADYLMGNHTAYTTKDGWIIKDCTDRDDCESLYHKNLECVAWMPLPQPYKAVQT